MASGTATLVGGLSVSDAVLAAAEMKEASSIRGMLIANLSLETEMRKAAEEANDGLAVALNAALDHITALEQENTQLRRLVAATNMMERK